MKIQKKTAAQCLSLMSRPVVSHMYGHLTRISRPRWLAQAMIRAFARCYHISMDEFQGDFSDYASLGSFFTRPLDTQVRPLTPVPNALVSPADGILSHVQQISSDEALQVKGRSYCLSALIGESQSIDFSRGFHLAVIYLAPSNYHRFHYPLDARLLWLRHLGERLFPVNRLGLSCIDNLFVRNERVVSCMETSGHKWYCVAVGAAFVGGIHMNIHPALLLPGQKVVIDQEVSQTREMGYFAMGSTLVLLVPDALVSSSCLPAPGSPVQAGKTSLFALEFPQKNQ